MDGAILPQEILDKLPATAKAEYAVLHNAAMATMRAYNSDPTITKLRDWEGAKRALAEKQEAILCGVPAGPDVFATQQEVLAYLLVRGYKIGKSALSNHVRARRLARRKDGFRRRDVDRFAELVLRNAGSGLDAKADRSADLLERKLKAEIRRTEEQAEKARIEREMMEGKLIDREQVEFELAGRAIALEAGFDHMAYTRAAEIVEACGGDHGRLDRVIDVLMDAKNGWLNSFANADDFVITVRRDENT